MILIILVFRRFSLDWRQSYLRHGQNECRHLLTYFGRDPVHFPQNPLTCRLYLQLKHSTLYEI